MTLVVAERHESSALELHAGELCRLARFRFHAVAAHRFLIRFSCHCTLAPLGG